MSYYNDVSIDPPREFRALPPDNYGTSKEPALKIVNYNGFKPTSTDPTKLRHSFLVASTNGVEGTAFFSIQLKKDWTTPEAFALAFPKEVEKHGLPPGTTMKLVEAMQQKLIEEATAQAVKSNSPDDVFDDSVKKIFENLLTQIRINVGSIFRLQSWKETDRDFTADLDTLVGTEFSGTVAEGIGGNSEVKSVYSKKKEKVATT